MVCYISVVFLDTVCIIVRPKDYSWMAYSAALTNTTTASDCQTPSGQIAVDEP